MKILAVDDDPIILALLGEIVDAFGDHSLVTAESARAALNLLAEGTEVDCFLLDIQMPEMDGVELCRRLRGDERFARTPILMLTAMSEKRYIDAAFAAGATDYLSKPFEIAELKARITLVDGLVKERQRNAALTVAEPHRPNSMAQHGTTPLHEPFTVPDVHGVIEHHALENYLTSLTRNALFGSSVFAFTIRRVSDLYVELSDFDFKCLIVDVAEAISDCLDRYQFLMSYVGNGTFVCVTEGGSAPDLNPLVNRIEVTLKTMDLHSSDGRPINVRLCAGKPMRLIWRSGKNALTALAEAHQSAEDRAAGIEQHLDSVWFGKQTA